MALTPNSPSVKKAIGSKSLKAAQADDERHRLHAEAVTSRSAASPYFARWVKEFVEVTLPATAKRDQFLSQLSWPPVTVAVVDQISDATAAVHQAEDRLIRVELSDEALQADCEQYLERIDLWGFLAETCHTALFSAPNSLVVVDLPAEQRASFPEPYCYLLRSSQVRAAEPVKSQAGAGLLNFAFFDTDEDKRYALFDAEVFSVYEGNLSDLRLVASVAHNLPFCPVFKMWADVDETNPLTSNTILRPLLGLLDRLLFWDGGLESNDLATAFMMLWHLETERQCDYVSEEGYRCEDGLVQCGTEVIADNGMFQGPRPVEPIKKVRCPACQKAKANLFGPGTRIPIPAQQNKDDADWREPAGFIAPPVENLTYVQDKVRTLINDILHKATGQEQQLTREAVNVEQVMSVLEKSRLVGNYLAAGFERLTRRLLDALCTLRYGAAYKGCTVNYGRRFTMLSADQLSVLSQHAKAFGADWLIETIDNLLIQYHGRGDAGVQLRARMLTDLNPYPRRTTAELVAAQIPTIDPNGYALSAGLAGHVARFEREEGMPIERWGILVDYNKRVTEILTALKAYVSEIKPKPEPQPSGSERGRKTDRAAGSDAPDAER